jgi:hypothetical protein
MQVAWAASEGTEEGTEADMVAMAEGMEDMEA